MSDEIHGDYPIQVIASHDVCQAVRTRPGMYFGALEAASEHIVNELISNTIDQFLAGRATWLSVKIDGDFIEVCDDGPGFPFDEQIDDEPVATRVFLRAHDTPTAHGHAPHIHVHALHGVGVAVVNAACAELHCTSWRGDEQWSQSFAAGKLTSPARVITRGHGRGTTIRLRVDPDLIPISTPRQSAIRRRLFDAVHLFPGLRASFGEEVFFAPHGLGQFVELAETASTPDRHEWGERPTFHFRHESDTMLVEASARGYGDATAWKTWFNGAPTPRHGIHKRALEAALEAAGWRPLTAMIHLIATEPRFAGPVRDELTCACADGLDALLLDAVRRHCAEHSI